MVKYCWQTWLKSEATSGRNLWILQGRCRAQIPWHCIVFYITYRSVTMLHDTITISILNLDPNVCLNLLVLQLMEQFLVVLLENIVCRLSIFSVCFHRQTLTNNAARGEVEIRRLAEQLPRLKSDLLNEWNSYRLTVQRAGLEATIYHLY